MINKDDLATLLLCSLRYAMGRKSYITEVVANLIRDNYKELSDLDQELILRDLTRELEFASRKNTTLGMDIDHDIWVRLANDLKELQQEL